MAAALDGASYKADFETAPAGDPNAPKSPDVSWTMAPGESVEVDLYINGTASLVSGGVWLEYDSTQVSIVASAYDSGTGGTVPVVYNSLPGDWDPTMTAVVAPDSNTILATVGTTGQVDADGDGDILLFRFSLSCPGAGTSTVSFFGSKGNDFIIDIADDYYDPDCDTLAIPLTQEVECVDDTDCEVNNGLWCDGVATCVDNVCDVTGLPFEGAENACDDGNACTENLCTEAMTPGDTTPGSCDNPCAGVSGPSDVCCADPACSEESACGGVGISIPTEFYWGAVGIKVDLCLDNTNFEVGALQVTVCDVPNCLVCIGCEMSERTVLFDCFVNDIDGCCEVILISKNPGGVINPGLCNIVKIDYRKCDPAIDDPCEECDCVELTPDGIAADPYGRPLPLNGTPGTICPYVCGDVHPSEDDTTCGDGDVDLMDIMTEVNLALDNSSATTCQWDNGDVPTGTPGRVPGGCDPVDDKDGCCPPDEVINILDIMTLIDMALNRQDCCTYYYTDIIY
jgi:hypothetical protein